MGKFTKTLLTVFALALAVMAMVATAQPDNCEPGVDCAAVAEPAPPVMERMSEASHLVKRQNAAPTRTTARGSSSSAETPKVTGGILSPIQFRPIALQLSMPFALFGLGMVTLLFLLMLHASTAISGGARIAAMNSK